MQLYISITSTKKNPQTRSTSLRPPLQIPPQRPLLPSRLTQHPLLLILALTLAILVDNLPNSKVLLTVPEEPLPMRHLLMHPRPRQPAVLLAAHLLLPGGHLRIIPLIINRDEHLLDAVQIRRQVLLEAARDEGARGVAAGEEVVIAAGAVHHSVCRDVEDGAVDGEVDREGGVRAVVEGELGWC